MNDSRTNPVSTLVEYATKQRVPPPNFVFKVDPIETSKFKCTCIYNENTTTGLGLKKKEAKRVAAHNMLNLIGCDVNLPLPDSPKVVRIESIIAENKITDPVSILNEYCLKNKYDIPAYKDAGLKRDNFVQNCVYKELVGRGLGKTKKNAKRNAAQNMLHLIMSKNRGKSEEDEQVYITIGDENDINSKQESDKEKEEEEEEAEEEGEEGQQEAWLTTIHLLEMKLRNLKVVHHIDYVNASNPAVLVMDAAHPESGNKKFAQTGSKYENTLIRLLKQAVAHYSDTGRYSF